MLWLRVGGRRMNTCVHMYTTLHVLETDNTGPLRLADPPMSEPGAWSVVREFRIAPASEQQRPPG